MPPPAVHPDAGGLYGGALWELDYFFASPLSLLMLPSPFLSPRLSLRQSAVSTVMHPGGGDGLGGA